MSDPRETLERYAAHLDKTGHDDMTRDAILAVLEENERLRAALQHAMVCDFPEEIRFRCEGCVKAEKALKGEER